ncbi:hypothetical protein TVAG_083850 [Trichomonas vaginalis G3]|uniref:PAS domain-containing protein n=1 Tax=Trichomonas vaginalis (strain ATCC PRA-98 / G3) TaxID=412133 RepID=A2DMA9_TRIV3|nr:hypothetical protein TVAGG3_0983450 [Trichomonas vaginalis G3]EAY18529.1 hypothetical protein TVAG_083850 [Trichomonas vaginalis G3]KAI5489481.1 hypothetical protein TVAGG3_0983450 [Trichomonas vaginalis G3]|eukprot:XP_001579515.1 hypothetical protein [Trichomonas vaginalis G3]
MLWHYVQIFAAANTLPLVLTIVEQKQDIISNALLVVLMFIIPSSLDQPNVYYITSFQLIIFLCIFIFCVSVYRIKRSKTFNSWQIFFSYVFSFEISRVLLLPNIIFVSRSLICSLAGIYPLTLLNLTQVLLLVAHVRLCYYASLFSFSFFKTTQIPRTLLVLPEHIQLYILPFIGWGCFSLGTKNQGITSLIVFCILLGIVYLYMGLYPKSFRGTIDPVSMAIAFLLFFQAGSGVIYIKGLNKFSYTYFIVASLVISLGIFLISSNIQKVIYKVYEKRLNSASKITDLDIKSFGTFQKYLCVAYHTHHKFLLDGSMINYACSHYHDIHSCHMLLRLALYLPISTPYVELIEINASSLNMSYTTLAYFVFEYRTVQEWRYDQLDPFDNENLTKTNRIVKNYIKFAFSYAGFIQREGSKSAFIFGQALNEAATIIESHIDRWLMFHPTRNQVLKVAAYFYDHLNINRQKAKDLQQQMVLYDYFTLILPNWRELQTINNYPIDAYSIPSFPDRIQTMSSDNITESTTQNDKFFANDIVYTETRSCMNVNFVILLLCVLGLTPFIIMIYICCRSYQKDFRALVMMTDYFGQHVYYVCGMMLYGIEPGYNSNITSEEKVFVSNFINEFATQHSYLYTQIMLLLKHYMNLNRTCSHLYLTPYFPSITMRGSPRVYSYDSMMRRIQTSVREVFPENDFLKNKQEFNVVVNMFANASSYFAIFLKDYNKCLTDSYDVAKYDIYKWCITWGSFIFCILLILISIPITLDVVLFRMNKNFTKIDSDNDSRLIEVSLSQKYYGSKYYIFMTIFYSLVAFGIIFLSIIANRVLMLELQHTVEEITEGDVADIMQMGILGTGLNSIELFGMNANVSYSTLYRNVAAVTAMWHPSDGKWAFENDTSSSTPLFDVVILLMKQLHGMRIVYNRTENKRGRDIFNHILRPLMKERIINRTSRYTVDMLRVNMENGQIQALLFGLITIVFYIIGTNILYFTKSVVFTEFILKLIPFVHQQTTTNTQDSMRMSNLMESKLLLDIIGCPAALIDNNDNIAFVNHEWMTVFSGAQTSFVGTNYHIYVGHDPDLVIHQSQNEYRTLTITRSSRIIKLRNQIDVMEDEYSNLNSSTRPMNVLSTEEKEKKVICATISIISYNLQNEDIDIVRTFSDLLFELISDELQIIKDAKMFMWSYSDITIAFGFEEESLVLPALQAIQLVSTCTQMLIETEELFGLYCCSSLMIGCVGDSFDGAKSRPWRLTNSITLSADVAHIISNYIADMTYILDNDIAVIIMEKEDEDIEQEE